MLAPGLRLGLWGATVRRAGAADGQHGRHADLASPVIAADGGLAWRRLTNAVWAAVLPSALPGVAFVPYAGAVPDGGRRGFEAAVAVRAPIV
jgi:hypothetical protein